MRETLLCRDENRALVNCVSGQSVFLCEVQAAAVVVYCVQVSVNLALLFAYRVTTERNTKLRNLTSHYLVTRITKFENSKSTMHDDTLLVRKRIYFKSVYDIHFYCMFFGCYDIFFI
jgi:hypothetical protein